MDLRARIEQSDQQSLELLRQFAKLDHRARELAELEGALGGLRMQMQELRAAVTALQTQIHTIRTRMPGIARREELERVKEKASRIPLRRLAP